ncbi:MAG: hypothetical protein QF633_06820 [Candidatus Poseidoniaceae archaeon]|jgi:hypothetical protein|nr:hypothetical protein [Candidatus Poseidoniaceae archaeon]
MTNLHPNEDETGVAYLLAATICWSSTIWFDFVMNSLLIPFKQWFQLFEALV